MAGTRQTVRAAAGDLVEVSGRRVGDPGRRGEIVEVLGAPEHPHFMVRWEDGHATILYPGETTKVHPRSRPRRHRTSNPKTVRAAEELVDFLREAEIEFEVLPHRRTTSAISEARALGVLAQTVAKTLVARDEAGRIRAVVPATSRLDLHELADAVGAREVSLLTEDELVGTYPEFELGAVPPFGGPAGDRVVVDRTLAVTDHVVVEAGVHDTSLRLRTEDVLSITDAQVAEIGE